MRRALIWLNLYGHETVWHKLKNSQKCIFGVFWPFLSLCWTALRPYRLSPINALRIRTNPLNFHKKILRIHISRQCRIYVTLNNVRISKFSDYNWTRPLKVIDHTYLFSIFSRSQRRATWRSCCINCVFVAQKLQRSTKTEDVDQVHRVGSRKGWEAYGVAFQVCGSGCFNGGSTSELHGRDGCGEWLPMKSEVYNFCRFGIQIS